MSRLSWTIVWVLAYLATPIIGQENASSPHGEALRIDCRACHTTDSWLIDYDQLSFNHDTLSFGLTGQHKQVDCRSCHTSLVFNEAPFECASCHLDVHFQSLGTDCKRCHNTSAWIVDDVMEMHEQIAFPLIGVHAQVNCFQCHQNEEQVRFLPVGTQCIDCHRENYVMANSPNHTQNGFSENCTDCHSVFDSDWKTDKVDHSFFPLTGGHDIQDCARCHNVDNYSDISGECVSCHREEYNNTSNPNHAAANIGIDCKQCHTADAEWVPADFVQHDMQYFPIYSGEHEGEWMQCVDCHTDPGDFSQFDCLICHVNPETDNQHGSVQGYAYENQACLACHPTGSADESFDHNATNFPLTGAHTMISCEECHANGYQGTPTDCAACHQVNYDQSENPNHQMLGLSTDCASCHTTVPDWQPASFDVHDDFYPLNGAHELIKMDCATCHNGDYNNTPNTCFDCHKLEYDNTSDPDHNVLQFSQECLDCHNELAWVPSTFDHDMRFFPIYSGSHQGEWSECVDCHTTPGDYTQYTCVTCHTNPETNDVHQGVQGYSYNSSACLACHPTGDADVVFDHNNTAFPLTGAHTTTTCVECHANGYTGTPTQCEACHQEDYNQTTNPNHANLGLRTDCASCHTTEPGWAPASFDVHDNFYLLEGAHNAIRNDCAQCHNGDYNNTPNTCFACHQEEYEQTSNPPHVSLNFSQDCASCHGQENWVPSTFDHDGLYFPIYSGKHQNEWTECIDCHTNVANYSEFTCIGCHLNPETDDAHLGVQGYVYQDDACLACHPTGDADMSFDHNTTAFPLTGGHVGVDCIMCHSGGYMGTPTNCDACHSADYNSSSNPDHSRLGISMDCASCHTTEPGWSPAGFDIHDQYYELKGAHAAIRNDCAVCHNGDYVNTPNTCVSCHQEDYDQTQNPSHNDAQFSTDCASCHTEDAWEPSTFDHDGMYFPVYTGTHMGTWNDCVECHTNPLDYAEFSCIGCHEHNMDDMDEKHMGVNGYSYNSIACLICHPTGLKDEGFDHGTTAFPLTGAHTMVACLDCHENGFVGTPTDCKECHQEHFDMTNNPDHGKLGISTDCAACHTTEPGWMPAAFPDHDSYYTLTGAHNLIRNDCAKCHMGDYANTPNTCDGCHLSDYNGSTNPNHSNLGLPRTCDDCHTTDPGWAPATFDIHDNYYALTGAHDLIRNDCAKCHMGDYTNTPNTCDGCHLPDYNGSTNPNHSRLGIPQTCDDCHTTDPGWAPATFDIHDNYYALTGAHDLIRNDCAKCHMGDYTNTPTTCDGCHLSDYNGSTNPNHATLGIPRTCDDCHTTDPGWAPASFDIHDNYYALTGAHNTIRNDCATCHMGDYVNTPNTCDGCHLSDYNGSTNPNHSSLGIPKTCDDCHTTDPGWMPATFDIHDNYYVLSGAHLIIKNDCFKCHMGSYNGTPNTCFGCHSTEYNNTTNPNHASAGFPVTCESCHTESAWLPSTWDHDNMYFPIYSGKHRDEWTQCVDCHTIPGVFTTFSCIDCHEHNDKTEVDDDHDQVTGYSYSSTACYSCHPTGEE